MSLRMMGVLIMMRAVFKCGPTLACGLEEDDDDGERKGSGFHSLT